MSAPDAPATPSRRSQRSTARAADALAERLDVLGQVVALSDHRLDPAAADHARSALDAARGRLGHGTTHTVVALAGATGSGKSSMFNALVGEDLAEVGVRRPTTSSARAEVDRLVEVVDAFVWVVDPQKYADAALHEGYLRRFAGHAAVTLVVLNQIDLLAETDRAATQ
ncbi:MAG: GTPase, partial [Candidatus Microthrix subdominans]